VNWNNFKTLQINLSGLSFWLTLVAIAWLLGSIGLGWIIQSIAIFVLLLFLAPIVAFIVFRWWLQRNLVQGECPVCQSSLAAVKGMQLACPNCGEPLTTETGRFTHLTPPGTVDVEVVEVSSVQQLED
jgi:hypothetical protein